MKVLFAIGSDQRSKNIADRYYDKFGETLEYKNVYYFKALLEEVRNNKTYNVIVIHEELEQYAAKDIEQFDRKLYAYVDSITDEIQNTDIVYICSDRRTKEDKFVVNLYRTGIYNILLGDDRNINPLCEIIKKPKTKREAKEYLNINIKSLDDDSYLKDDEVDEEQMIRIINYYEGIKDKPELYVETFDRISVQYSRSQLKVIASWLPKYIQEVIYKEPKYKYLLEYSGQSVSKTNDVSSDKQEEKKLERKHSQNFFGVFKKSKEKLMKNKNVSEKEVQVEPIKDETEFKSLQELTQMNSNEQQALAERARREAEEREQQAQALAEKAKQEAEILAEKARQEVAQREQQALAERAKQEAAQREQQALAERARQEAAQREQQALAERARQEAAQREQQALAERAKQEAAQREQQALAERAKQEAAQREQQALAEKARQEAAEREQQALAEKARQEAAEREQQALAEKARQEAAEREQQALAEKARQEAALIETKKSSNNIETFDIQVDNELNKGKEQSNNSSKINVIDAHIDTQNNISEEQKRFKEEQERLALEQEKIRKAKAEIEEERRKLLEAQEKLKTEKSQMPVTTIPLKTENDVMPSVVHINTKKMVVFVGANKAGTTFMINAVAQDLASKKIFTSIIDMTKDKGMYYIYNQGDNTLRKIASECMQKLSNGEDSYLPVNKFLKVYTTVPGGISDGRRGYKHKSIIETVKNSCNVTIVDADFTTPIDYFEQASDIYIVQDMDILKMQETTLFLREMKNRNMDMSKIKVIVNKYVKSILTPKRIIEGLSYYKDPEMTFIDTLLSNKVMYSTVPYNLNNYVRYVEALCKENMNFKGYTPDFVEAINDISEQIYPRNGLAKKSKGGFFG